MIDWRIVLASASPRRIELLQELGLSALAWPSKLPERALPGEEPRCTAARLAAEKVRIAESRCRTGDPPTIVIGADTVVLLGRRLLGKPRDGAEAVRMLRLLRGREHEVLTAVHLVRTDDGRSVAGTESTRVRFRDYPESRIRAYVASGEPMDKAGAYGIQGRGVLLVERIEGSWSNVVGFPLERLTDWLGQLDIDVDALLDRSSRSFR